MPIFGIDKGYRNIRRFAQILSVFVGYGFKDIVDRLHLEYLVRIGRSLARKKRLNLKGLPNLKDSGSPLKSLDQPL